MSKIVHVQIDRKTLPKDGEKIKFKTDKEEWYKGIFCEGDDIFQVSEKVWWFCWNVFEWESLETETKNTDPEILSVEQSVIVGACIECNKCNKVSAYEEWSNDIPYAAKTFYQDGWQDHNGIIHCPDCMNKIKSLTKRMSMKEKIVEYGTEHQVEIVHADKTLIACTATDLNDEGFMLMWHGLKELPKEGDKGKIIFERDNNRGHWQYYPAN